MAFKKLFGLLAIRIAQRGLGNSPRAAAQENDKCGKAAQKEECRAKPQQQGCTLQRWPVADKIAATSRKWAIPRATTSRASI